MTAVAVGSLAVSAYTVPTDAPESDGTLEWDSTTMVVVEVSGGGCSGLGYSYADVATACLVESTLAPIVVGRDARDVTGAWSAMVRAIRNLGRPGICSMAIAAVDIALWDLEARLAGVSLAERLGRVREAVPIYGSGGFTSYSEERLAEQLAGWVQAGIPRVKMKVGRDPEADPGRVAAARGAIGPDAELFVDANGAHRPAGALAAAEEFAEQDVAWFEEPVSSDDLAGMRRVREGVSTAMAIAAGEYGYDLSYFERMLESGAVDVLQADVTRCAGISEFMQVGALCQARGVPLSAHCAPALHAQVGCAVEALEHVEYFHDHARLERMLLDGAPEPAGGELRPDPGRPGLGLELRRADAERYAA